MNIFFIYPRSSASIPGQFFLSRADEMPGFGVEHVASAAFND